jgi:hypothetical protein
MKHSGVSEDQVREFSMMFKHFDKEKLGRLNHQDFKSCLRALGYDLPTVDDNQRDEQFEAILDIVDPNRFVLLNISYDTPIEKFNSELVAKISCQKQNFEDYIFFLFL